MMPEISLNILDVAQNSVKAGAKLTRLECLIDTKADTLTVIIDDDGCGMTKEQVEAVTDPFFTTRTTRKVGLGVPFFKMAAESSGGSFDIVSEVNVGLKKTNQMLEVQIAQEYTGHQIDVCYLIPEFKEILGADVSFNEPEVSQYIRDYLKENTDEVNAGQEF